MRKAASIAGIRRVSGGGASAPSTPTLSSVADNGNGQDADVVFTFSNLNGAVLTSISMRWSTSVSMTSPTTLTKTSNVVPSPAFTPSTALASVTAGSSWAFGTSSMTGTRPADGVSAYYQIALTNSAGTSAWSSTVGPMSTSTI